jgi:hypothetical protein
MNNSRMENEQLRDALNQLRFKIDSLLDHSHKLVDVSDSNLIRIIKARKYDIDRCLEATIQLHNFNSKHKDSLNNVSKEEIKMMSIFLGVIIEKNCDKSDGRIIVTMKPSRAIKLFTPESKLFNPHAVLRYNIWLFDQLSRDVTVQNNGMVLFISFEGISLWDQIALSTYAPLSDQLATFEYLQILGIKFKGVYVFEQSIFLSWIWLLAKPFMTEVFKDRFHLCGNNYETIDECVDDKSILPTFLGGNVEVDDERLNAWIDEKLAA